MRGLPDSISDCRVVTFKISDIAAHAHRGDRGVVVRARIALESKLRRWARDGRIWAIKPGDNTVRIIGIFHESDFCRHGHLIALRKHEWIHRFLRDPACYTSAAADEAEAAAAAKRISSALSSLLLSSVDRALDRVLDRASFERNLGVIP